jgi:hypothetical protein
MTTECLLCVSTSMTLRQISPYPPTHLSPYPPYPPTPLPPSLHLQTDIPHTHTYKLRITPSTPRVGFYPRMGFLLLPRPVPVPIVGFSSGLPSPHGVRRGSRGLGLTGGPCGGLESLGLHGRGRRTLLGGALLL